MGWFNPWPVEIGLNDMLLRKIKQPLKKFRLFGQANKRCDWSDFCPKKHALFLSHYSKVKPTNHSLVVLIQPTYLDGISRYTLHSSAVLLPRTVGPRAGGRSLPPRFWQICLLYLNQGWWGADYAHQITTHPTTRNFRSSYSPATYIRKKKATTRKWTQS